MEHGKFYECHICKGTGKDKSKYKDKCTFCWGEGKVDWIENIIGKKKPTIDIEEAMIENAALELAKRIDKEILETVFINYYRR